MPDAIELDAHGSLILGREDEAQVTEARVLDNGTATYLVRYFRSGRELHGNGVLSVDSLPGVTAEARTTFVFENRESLTLNATAVGPAGAGGAAAAADERRVSQRPGAPPCLEHGLVLRVARGQATPAGPRRAADEVAEADSPESASACTDHRLRRHVHARRSCDPAHDQRRQRESKITRP